MESYLLGLNTNANMSEDTCNMDFFKKEIKSFKFLFISG